MAERIQPSPFIRKLRQGAPLTAEDEATLSELAEPLHRIERGDITPEGSDPRFAVLIIKGWACCYKLLENGKRQITSVYLPGDLCEPFGVLPRTMGYTLGALTPVLLARIPPQALRAAARASSLIEEALWWDLLLSGAMHREHLVSLGRRTATERLGHFLCEVHLRLGMVGLVDHASCDFPLTQPDLADMSGLSTVHVNRSLQELRSSGMISLRERRLTLHDADALREMSMFNSDCFPLRGINFNPVAAAPQRRPEQGMEHP